MFICLKYQINIVFVGLMATVAKAAGEILQLFWEQW